MLDKITEGTKLVIQYAWAIWLITAVILFAPVAWLVPLGIGPFVSQYRPYIGLFFLVATVLLLGQGAKPVRERIAREVANRQMLAKQRERLHHLTTEEQVVLREFIARRTRTASLYWEDGVVRGLERDKVLWMVLPFARDGLPSDFNMENWAYDYLLTHPELVGLNRPTAVPPADSEVAG
jgi:Super-infection exclusion protein B